MKSAITISLVEETRNGPFVYCGNLTDSMREAKELGFDAVEIFPPDADAFRQLHLAKPLAELGLSVAAVGTGAGWVRHRLQLADEDQAIRARAIQFIRSIIECAAELGAPAIIGSMQGRSSHAVDRKTAKSLLRDGLNELSQHAKKLGTVLLYEPLNRYETDQCTTLAQGVALIEGLENVRLLADWFHMNIEEADMAASLRAAGEHVGHIHFADSNRCAIGMGHLRDIRYNGFLSAEVFANPSPFATAKQTIESYRKLTQLSAV
jgi:sugar phosphate isomerase/epimerase